MKIKFINPFPIIPWAASGLRPLLLTKFLKENGHKVEIISFSNNSNNEIKRNIWGINEYIINFSQDFKYIKKIMDNFFQKNNIINRRFEYLTLLEYDDVVIKKIEKMIKSTDIIHCDHVFLGNCLNTVSENMNIPLEITSHNVESDIFLQKNSGKKYNKNLFNKLLNIYTKKEIEAINSCDCAVCVSKEDMIKYKKYGVKKINLIENCLDFSFISKKNVLDFSKKYELNEKTALFVGTPWFTNIEAIDIISNIISPKCPDFKFLIVGDFDKETMSKYKKDNIEFTGKITFDELLYIYRNSNFVLIPLKRGSGSSFKMVEALMNGKIIISSSIGSRGFKIKNNYNAIVCDKFSSYPKILYSLLKNKRRQERLKKMAILTGRKYDYKIIYKKYLKLYNNLLNRV